MSIVAGVDFGTLSVRISIFDKARGKLGSAVADYPLHSSPTDPHLKTQSHHDQMAALVRAMHDAVRVSGIDGREIKSIALDTTGSSVIPVGENLEPLGEYYLWCDHRAAGEAAFRDAYFALGSPDAPSAQLGHILPELQTIQHDALAAGGS